MRSFTLYGIVLAFGLYERGEGEKSDADINDLLSKLKGMPGMENMKVFGRDDMDKMAKGESFENLGKKPTHDYRQELIDFYTKYGMEEKIDGVDAALAKWKGKEYKMMVALRKKYKDVIAAHNGGEL